MSSDNPHNWYVGVSHDPQHRLEQHRHQHRHDDGSGSGGGSDIPGAQWTKLHPPVEGPEALVYHEYAPARLGIGINTLEDALTHSVMFENDNPTGAARGEEHVRGGSTCRLALSLATLEKLRTANIQANNLCFRCMQRGHKASSARCPMRRQQQLSSVDRDLLQTFPEPAPGDEDFVEPPELRRDDPRHPYYLRPNMEPATDRPEPAEIGGRMWDALRKSGLSVRAASVIRTRIAEGERRLDDLAGQGGGMDSGGGGGGDGGAQKRIVVLCATNLLNSVHSI